MVFHGKNDLDFCLYSFRAKQNCNCVDYSFIGRLKMEGEVGMALYWPIAQNTDVAIACQHFHIRMFIIEEELSNEMHFTQEESLCRGEGDLPCI